MPTPSRSQILTELSPLELRAVRAGDAPLLEELFGALEAHGDRPFFEPHPLNAESARTIEAHRGNDFYGIAAEGDRALAYGILRGWDEGYSVPSLGIAVHPAARGEKLAPLMMRYLHAVAYRRGAERVRLRVHRANARAATLYRNLGYEFSEAQGDFLVAFFSLRETAAGEHGARK